MGGAGAGPGLEHVDIYTVGRWGCAMSTISAISAATMIGLFYKRRATLNTLWNRIIVQLGMVYVLAAVTALLTELPLTFGSAATLSGTTCTVQAFMVQWLAPMDLLLNVLLASTLYAVVVWRVNVHRIEPYAIGFIWLAPAVLSAVLLANGVYGQAVAWCWVRPEYFSLQLAVLYVWVWCGFLVMTVLELLVARQLRAHLHVVAAAEARSSARCDGGLGGRRRRRRVSSEFYLKLSFYPVLYLITWTPASVNRVLEGINLSVVDSSAAFACQMVAIQAGGFLFLCLFVRNNWTKLFPSTAHGDGAERTGLLSTISSTHSVAPSQQPPLLPPPPSPSPSPPPFPVLQQSTPNPNDAPPGPTLYASAHVP